MTSFIRMALVTMRLNPEQTFGGNSKGLWEIDACYVNLKERSGENNWVKRIIGVKRADNRSFKKKLARSRLTWAGNVETMGDEKLAMRTEVQKVEGKAGEKTEIAMGRTTLGGI